MPDPFDQLAADTVEREYGARPPRLSPPTDDTLDKLFSQPPRKAAAITNGNGHAPRAAPMGDSYDQLLDGFFGRNGQGADVESHGAGLNGSAEAGATPLPPWPPPMAVSPGTEAAFSDEPLPTVGPRAEKPGLFRRMAGKLGEVFTGGPSPDEKLAGRGFSAQAEIEARQDPRWKDLLTDNAKLRFLNVYRRRYGLESADKIEQPEDIGDVAGRQWGTLRGLVEKLPFVAEGITAYELGSLHLALSHVEQGKGTTEDWELLTQLQERMAKESRGRTIAGQGLNIASESVPFWMGLGAGQGLTKPLMKGAAKAAEKTIGKAATKAAVDAMTKMAARKTLGGVATKAAMETAKRGLPQIAVSTTADTVRRMLPGYQLLPGDETALDYAVRAPGQDFLGALRDSTIKATIEVYSEFTGDALGIIATGAGRAGQKLASAGAKVPGLRKIAVPAERAGQWIAATRAAIPAAMQKMFPNKFATREAATAYMREVGIGNVVEEMGEERIGELMEAAAKAVIEEGGGKSTLEKYHVPEFDQLKAEFLGFMIPGTVRNLGAAMVPEERAMGAVRDGVYRAFNDQQPPRTPPGPGEYDIPETPSGPKPPMEVFPARRVGGTPDVGGGAQPGTSQTATEDTLSVSPPSDETLDQLFGETKEAPHETIRPETETGGPAGETIAPARAQAQPKPGPRPGPRTGGDPAERPPDARSTGEAAQSAGARGPGAPAAGGVEEPDEPKPRYRVYDSKGNGWSYYFKERAQAALEPGGRWEKLAEDAEDLVPPDHIADAGKMVSGVKKPAQIITDSIREKPEGQKPKRVKVKAADLQPGDVIKGLVDSEGGQAETIARQLESRPGVPGVLFEMQDGARKHFVEDQQFHVDRPQPSPQGQLKPPLQAEAFAPTEARPPAAPAAAPATQRSVEEADRHFSEVAGRLKDLQAKHHAAIRDRKHGKIDQRTLEDVAAQVDVARREYEEAYAEQERVHGEEYPGVTIREAALTPTRGGIVVTPLGGGVSETITPESIDRKKQELERLRAKARVTPTHKEGDSARWMNDAVTVKDSQVIDGVEYTLAHGKDNGYVRVFDLDTNNVIALKRFPSRALADEEFRDIVEKSLRNAPKAAIIKKEVPREPGRQTAAPAPDRPAGERPPEPRREGGAPRPEGRAAQDVPGAGGARATVPVGLGEAAPGGATPGRADRAGDAAPRGVGAGGPGLRGPAAEGIEGETSKRPNVQTSKGKEEGEAHEPERGTEAGLPGAAAGRGPGRAGQPDQPAQGPGGDRGGVSQKGGEGQRPDSERAGAGEPGRADSGDRGKSEPTRTGDVIDEREAGEVPKTGKKTGEQAAETSGQRPGPGPGDAQVSTGPQGDYVITDPGNLFATGPKTIFRRNVEAIRTVKKIEAENRPATEEEKAVLVQYQGWGSLPEAFLFYDPKWKKEAEELRDLLTPEEYKAAEGSTKNAMYTPPEIATAMWRAVERMGFKGGAILEPAAGVGHFFGLQPGHLLPGSRRVATEKDNITAAIAKALYPGSNVRHTPFEDAALAKNYFDLAVSNVPFGQLFINDKRYPAYLRQFIHDYFFARSIDLVRPGGLLAFITTKGTMDKGDDRVRRYLAERADLLGAIRLNDKSLPGTQVTTDVIFLKKRAEREPAGGEAWVNSRAYEPLPGKIINEYFQKHPEMVLGEIKAGSLYSSGEEGPTATIVAAPAGFDLERDINAAVERLPKDVFGTTRAEITRVDDVSDMIPSPANLPAGTLFTNTGDRKLYRAAGKGDLAEPIEGTISADKGAKAVERAKAIVAFRDTVLEVLRVSTDPKGDERLIELQKKLNQQYDALARKGFTPFSSSTTTGIFAGDLLTLSLINSPQVEKYDKAAKKATKGDIFTRAMLAAYERPTSAETASDALSISLDEFNRIDLERIGALLGVDAETAKQRLLNEALAYTLPGDQLVLAADYLSGPVRAKLRDAEVAAELDPIYQPNVEALKRVQPADVPPSRVRVTLGAPWIPGEVIEDFIIEQAGERFRDMLQVKRSDAIGQWVVSGAKYIATPKTTQKWGTADYNMAELVEAAMSMQVPKVVRSEGTGDNKITWTDQPATDAAITKLREVRDFFEHWVWAHEKWGPQLLADFNRIYNDSIKRVWDGKHLTLPGSNPLIEMRSYQKDAVYRNIASSYNTIDDIAVGGGKTFIAAATAMEAIRLGLARKVLITVDRATLDQFIEGARTLYPGGQFIGLSTKELAPNRRAKTLASVALADKTVFIMPHNQFKALPVSEKTLLEFYDEMLREIDQAIEEAKNEKSKAGKRVVKRLQGKRDNLESRLKRAIEGVRKIASVPFEELGIDWIIYDEAHKAKNLRFETQMDAVRGLGNPAGSQTALDLLMKTQYVSRLQGGRGVTFLTGTPVNNSISEIYAMQRYLQPQTLLAQGIRSFDDWVRVFAEEAADMEKVAGRYKWVTRLRKFKNLKGLYGMWDQIAHSVPHEEVMRVVQEAGGDIPKIALDEKGERNPTMVVRDVTPGQKAYQKVINSRREAVLAALKKGPPQKGDDIMLSIITDEKKASLDMRFIYPGSPEEPGNKLTAAANRIVAVHKEFEKQRLTQLVFLNMGAPGSATAFGAYADLIGKLTAGGIARDEIATIFDAQTDAQRGQLFKRVNSGEIRVLIGSMKKMGQGVNVQQRLIALHQLEPAWEPGTLIQVMGRILRSGNEIVKQGLDARIFRYVSKGMSDESMYSLLAAKQKVNSDFLSGRLDTDEIEDLDISYLAFQMAQAEGAESKTVFEWTKADQQLKRMQGEARYFRDTRIDLRNQIVSAAAMRDRARAMIPRAKAFAKYVQTLPPADPFEMVVGKTTYDDKMTDAGKGLFAQAEKLALDEQVRIGSVRGLAMFLRFDKVFGSAQWRATLSLRLPPDSAEHEKFLADAGTKLMSVLHWDKTAPPTDRALANWVSEITRDIDGISERPWETQFATQSKKAAELEEEIGKPFARQKEMDELAKHVAKLADQLSREAEDAARAGEGRAAEDLGQGETEDEEDGEEKDDGDDEGGAGPLSNFPPGAQRLLPDNISPEHRRWLVENWHGDTPLFGMGAAGAGPPGPETALGKARQFYFDSWDRTVEKMKNMPSATLQRYMDWLARLLYPNWKIPIESPVGQALDIAKGSKHIGQERSAALAEKLQKDTQVERQTEIGKPWPEEAWDQVRSAALAVLKGGHALPDTLPRDLKKVWDAYFGWVKHVSGAMTPKDRRLEIEYQLEKVNEQIEELRGTTLVKNMPDVAFDAMAVAHNQKIIDVAEGREEYDNLPEASKQWVEHYKRITDSLTDEMLNDPVVMEAAKGGGLINFEEIVRMRRQSGAMYTRSLYYIVRDPAAILQRDKVLLGPRLPLGMTRAKRAKGMYIVTLPKAPKGMGAGPTPAAREILHSWGLETIPIAAEVQFTSAEEAAAFAAQMQEAYREEYGESVMRRIQVIDPLTDEQVEWLGPVKDLRVLAANTITGMYSFIATARLFAVIDATEALDADEYADLPEDQKHRYKKIPNSAAFARIAGKYVLEATHNALFEAHTAYTGIASEFWSFVLGVTRSAFVILNPATHMRAAQGNVFNAIQAGLNPFTNRKWFAEAMERLSHGLDDPEVHELMRRNQLHGGMDRHMAGRALEAIRTPTNSLMTTFGIAWERGKRAKDEIGKFYSFMDHVLIMASWLRDTKGRGLPPELALPNLEFFQNYERVGRAARFLRNVPVGDPFASFADQAIKIELKAMRERPGTVLGLYAAPALMHLAARVIYGVTDDEMRLLDAHPQRKSIFDRYFQPVVYRDSRGVLHTWDLRFVFPLANEFRVATGPGGIGIPFLMKQPWFGPLVDVARNQDAFTGRKISAGEALTTWEAIAHVVWKSAPLPSIATRAPLRIYRAATGESGENLFMVVLKEVFGVSIMPRYASKSQAYKLVRNAVGDRAAGRAVQLIDAYQKLERSSGAVSAKRR